ncbi:hypothetical protein FRC12_002049 [Ceratobasidium sp. 428]|nr:hypothetical protein FRC12_002049 [Ceratobasidium sp. 428]
MQSDRREISGLAQAANGQGPSSVENGKKRRLDDDRVASGGRRPNTNPFSGLSNNNLHQASRSKNQKTNTESHLRLFSGSTYSQSSGLGTSNMAGTIFPRSSVGSSALSPPRTSGNGLSTLARDNGSSRNGMLPLDATEQSYPPGLSTETDEIMSGTEHRVPIGDIFDDRDLFLKSHITAKAETARTGTSKSPRSSSADPIDFVSQSKPQPPPTGEPHHIIVDDLADDDEVEELVQTNRPTPRTPTGKTPFREGHVEDMKAKMQENKPHGTAKQNASTPSTLTSWLKPSSTTPAPVYKPRAPGKGHVVINAGFTRNLGQPAIQPPTSQPPANPLTKQSLSKSMRPKSGGLKLATVGPQSKPVHPSSKPSSTKPEVIQSASHPMSFELKVEEWSCAGTKYSAGKNQFKFKCDSVNRVSLFQTGNDCLMLMPEDFAEFEVAEPTSNTPSEEIIFPAICFQVTGKFASSTSWRKFSGDDTGRRMFVKFDASDGLDEIHWRGCVKRLADFIHKSIITPNAMRALFNFQQGETNNAVLQPSKKRPRPKLAKSNQSQQSEVVPPEVPPTMIGPSTRTKTRALATLSKDESDNAQPPAPPLQDPDEIMLVYPQSGTGAVNVNRAELFRLEDGEFLNDTLIELGLKLWINKLRVKDPGLVDQIHVFNSFFFKKLDNGRGKACDYNSVKKWTSKFDLFKKKFIIVPINEHLHWYLAVICFPEHVLRAPAPQPVPQPTRKTRSSNAGAAKDDEQGGSPESGSILNAEQDSIVDVDAGSPTEQGPMEVDNDLAERSQTLVIGDVDMTPVPPDAEINVDMRPVEAPATPPVLDMTDDDPHDATQDNANAQKCWILIFDSLRGKHTRTIRILREYLQAEAQERYGKNVETKDSKLSGGLIEDKHLPVPEQPNWCDCGVYLLHYVEAFVESPLDLLTLPSPKRKSPPEEVVKYNRLWRKEELDNKRKDFRQTVNELSAEWQKSKSEGIQALQTGPAAIEGSSSNARRASPLPTAVGELSIVEIDPPGVAAPLNEPATPIIAQTPIRTGTLPTLRSSSPNDHSLLQPDLDQVMSVEETPSPGNETLASEDQSSIPGHKRTRRKNKGGERHNPGYWSSRGTQASRSSIEL